MEKVKPNRDELKKDGERKRVLKSLKVELERARRDIEAAESNFEFVFKPSEVDIYIYELRRAQTKYDSILSKLKNLC